MTALEQGDAAEPRPIGDERRLYRWWVLGLLAAISAFSYIDRQLPFIMAEAIKKDLGLSDGQLGLIGGVAFSAFYTLLCLPVANLADRTSRKWVITIAVTLWSIMTMLSSAAMNMAQLFLGRVGVAIGESGSLAPSHSLIADYFGAGQRATALSIFSVGGTLGIMLGFAVGGWLADEIGWRATFVVLGAPGLLLGLAAALTLKEPLRPVAGGDRATAPGLFRAAFGLLRIPTYRGLLIAASFNSLSVTAFMAWLSPFFMRSHDFSAAQAGLAVGLLSGAVGSVSVLAGGFIADRLGRRDRRWQLWVPAIGAAAAVPFYLLGLLSPAGWTAVAMLLVASLAAMCSSGPVFAVVQDLADPRERSTASALIVLVVTFVGASSGPPAVGYLSDFLARTLGEESLRQALCSVLAISNTLAATVFILSARSARVDLAKRMA